ncbi:MAG: TIM44-like domain-containing protein [Nitrospinae bacterium]|nr:TIM44-like domain-containing protein [Nitrospinota bacterium]
MDDLETASAVSPAGRMLGSMLPLLLIAGLIALGFWLYRRNASPSLAASMASTGYAPGPVPMNDASWGGVSPAEPVMRLEQSDASAFTGLLAGIQEAWGRADINKLKRMVTPEMLAYFSEMLSNNTSQGVENRVEQVKVLKQEVNEAWAENDLQYATVLFVWNALDYTVNLNGKPGDPDYVVEGDMRQPVEASEAWTFVRSRGGHWLLSAIQQI